MCREKHTDCRGRRAAGWDRAALTTHKHRGGGGQRAHVFEEGEAGACAENVSRNGGGSLGLGRGRGGIPEGLEVCWPWRRSRDLLCVCPLAGDGSGREWEELLPNYPRRMERGCPCNSLSICSLGCCPGDTRDLPAKKCSGDSPPLNTPSWNHRDEAELAEKLCGSLPRIPSTGHHNGQKGHGFVLSLSPSVLPVEEALCIFPCKTWFLQLLGCPQPIGLSILAGLGETSPSQTLLRGTLVSSWGC